MSEQRRICKNQLTTYISFSVVKAAKKMHIAVTTTTNTSIASISEFDTVLFQDLVDANLKLILGDKPQ